MMKAQMYLLNKNNGFSMIEECMLIQELVDKACPELDSGMG